MAGFALLALATLVCLRRRRRTPGGRKFTLERGAAARVGVRLGTTQRAAVTGLAAACLLAPAAVARADQTPQPLPVAQSWTDTALLAESNDWSTCPGFLGRRGNQLITTEGVDPQSALAGGDATQVSLHANRTDADSTEVPGVAEFELADPIVGLHATNLADAPHLVLALDTTGSAYVRVVYDVVDLDGSDDDSASPLALQVRAGGAGPYTNVPAGFVADATVAGAAGQTSHVDLILPIGGLPLVEVRWLTTNQVGQDEWIGIDDIEITASPAPTAAGWSAPHPATAGAEASVVVDVVPGSNPASTELAVRCNLTLLGLTDTELLFDDGLHGDGAAGDLRFARGGVIGAGVPAGIHQVPCRVRDAEDRRSELVVLVDVAAVCGDGKIENAEECDDANDAGGDGCADDCVLEPDWICAGEPSVCDPCPEGHGGDGTSCEAICGDGLIVGGETCDDGGTAGDDGCDEFCHLEPGFLCGGEPSVCAPDRDADGVADGLDNCPELENGSQADADDDGIGDACDDDDEPPPQPEEGGGCRTAPGAAPWALLLALLAVQRRSSSRRRAARRRSS
jgi:cysteine-rich repeat protein